MLWAWSRPRPAAARGARRPPCPRPATPGGGSRTSHFRAPPRRPSGWPASWADLRPLHLTAATAYADVVAGREADGNPISGFDGQIAAICRSQAATLATRNTKDFIDTGISL